MLKAWAAGVLAGAVGGVVVAVAQDERSVPDEVTGAVEAVVETHRRIEAQQPAPVASARRAVEAHRARLEGEIAELAAILAAQSALMEYVESGGAREDEGLDPRLCAKSALRPLCPELRETFGESGG